MAKKQTARTSQESLGELTPTIAAMLTGTVYQARLFNRQARMNVPESEVIAEVVGLWRNVLKALRKET